MLRQNINIWPLALVLISMCLPGDSKLEHNKQAPDKDLMECFTYKYNYWLVGFAFATTSIQFKNDCLRSCLISQMRGNVTCRSAMHVPNDQECILADQDEETMPALFVENHRKAQFTVNYYSNRCANPPTKQGVTARARLRGFRGGEGLIRMVQRVSDRNRAYVHALLVDLSGRTDYTIFAYDQEQDADHESCPQLTVDAFSNLTLVHNVSTDHTGMAVVPWRLFTNVGIWSRKPMKQPKRFLVVEKDKRQFVTCGTLTMEDDLDKVTAEFHKYWENSSAQISVGRPGYCLLSLFFVLITILHY